MKRNPFVLVAVGLLLLLLIWLAWPNNRDAGQEGESARAQPETKIPRNNLNPSGTGKSESQYKTKRERPGGNSAKDNEGFSQVDRLLVNEAISEQEAAEQLRKIASDTSYSLEVRSEALGHGVLLDLAIFAPMAADTQLPEEMSNALLESVINANDDRALQIRTLRDFLGNPSTEIREEAGRVLAHHLEIDFDELSAETLIQMADDELKRIDEEKRTQEQIDK